MKTLAALDRVIDELLRYRLKVTAVELELLAVWRRVASGLPVDRRTMKTLADDLAFYAKQIERMSDKLGLFAFSEEEKGA